MNENELYGYFKLYNVERFEQAVNSFYVEDASFWNTRIGLCVRQKIFDWLYASHQSCPEKLTPINLTIEPDTAAVELEQEFHASEDVSHFSGRSRKARFSLP
jgi:hypothetical protein